MQMICQFMGTTVLVIFWIDLVVKLQIPCQEGGTQTQMQQAIHESMQNLQQQLKVQVGVHLASVISEP